MCINVIFPVISVSSTDFIWTLIKGWPLKEGDAYFKVRRVTPMKFQNFAVLCFQIMINNYHSDIYIVFYIPELLAIFIVLLFLYLLYILYFVDLPLVFWFTVRRGWHKLFKMQ